MMSIKRFFLLVAAAIALAGLFPQPGAAVEYHITGSVNTGDFAGIEILLQGIEAEFLSTFGLDSNYRLQVYVCKDLQEFLRLTRVNWWNGGHFQRGTIYLQRLQVLKERGILPQTLSHEFLHFCIWRVAGNSCPLWLNEGLVLNLTGEVFDMGCLSLGGVNSIKDEDLDKRLQGKDREQAKLAYCRAALKVRALLCQQGIRGVIKILKSY